MTIKNSTVQGTEPKASSLFSAKPPKLQPQGYFMYQFLDQEANLTPYLAGTYLGKKNIFNIGAGFVSQRGAMWHLDGADTVSQNINLVAIDFIYEKQLNKAKQTALTVYLCFSHYDFGKNYIRNISVMNPTNGVNGEASFNGAGNAFPMVGTGNTVYTQAGYLFPDRMLDSFGTLQV